MYGGTADGKVQRHRDARERERKRQREEEVQGIRETGDCRLYRDG
jgi:hypothetical protein